MLLMIDAIWNSTNLTTTFSNVARSLTNQIRDNIPNRHQGVMQEWTIHVKVRWAYLAFPITLLTSGLVYVVLIIVEATRLKMPVWKGAALPTMLYGFDDEMQRLLREEEESKPKTRTRIRYARDRKEECLRLVAA